jgi:glycosyltransferase involved in cell wall biosynthesis
VATDVGGVRGALDDGRSGLLVPPGDARALAVAVTALADDAELRERLTAHGAERTRELTIERQASTVARFLAEG